MARFRFVAADSTGTLHDGAIDAATQTDARNKLASNGLAVRELEEVAAGGGAIPPELPRRAAQPPRPVATDLPTSPPKRAPRAELADAPRRGSGVPMLLSIVALVVSLAAGAYVIYRDPPWGRLSRYDFSTAERAYMSTLRIEANADFQAMLELQRKLDGKRVREKLDSVKIPRTANHQGKTILFIEYDRKGTRVRDIACYEKDAEHGNMWKQAFISDEEIRTTNPALAGDIQRWRSMAGGAMMQPDDGQD